MENYQHVFDALPNVKAIWVQEDGSYYLDEFQGGQKIERGAIVQEKIEVKPKKAAAKK